MNTFLISDTHFSHKGVCEFLNNDGTKMRPWNNTEEMDEALVANWNSVVRPKDKIYHLGDVVINRKALPILGRLNGEKILVRGNHDVFRLNEYTPYFKDVRGTHKLDKFILSHVPIHPNSIPQWCEANVHGHLHNNRVLYTNYNWNYFEEVVEGVDFIDPNYFCVSVEQINYTPIALEELKKIIKEQQ